MSIAHPALPAPVRLDATDQLDADIATLTALRKALDGHPDLPELVSRHLHDAGGSFTPYLPGRPLTALLRVVEAIPHGMFIRHRPGPGGDGTEVYAAGKLDGRTVELVVHTWRFGPGCPERIVTARNGLISRDHLAALADIETSLLGGPDDPLTERLGLDVAPVTADPSGVSGI